MHPSLSPQRERYLLFTLAGIQFSHILDFMIVMPLGPSLIKAFGIGTHEFGLLVASYSFSAALSGLLAAMFIDRFERKRLLLVIFGLFGVATLACGLSPTFATLIASRCLAGAFGGVMGAMVQTIVADVIPFARRAKAGGIVSTAFSLATVAGVPLSLWLANHFQWRAPFILIATLTILLILTGMRTLPELHHHISSQRRAHPFVEMFAVLRDPNHLSALLFSALIIFSGFTVIPYITIYSVGNIGISIHDVPFIYLTGGAATLFTARLIGHWADLRGKVKIYRLVAIAALVPVYIVTNVGAAPMWVWLICTTAFFVLVSGRMIPAMTIIVSAAQPKLRGTFMSLNATIQAFAMGLATMLAGFIITQNGAGQIEDYGIVGCIGITGNVLAIIFASRIVMHDQHATVPDVALK
jgi:predicted MFS family arabinose efflux permease